MERVWDRSYQYNGKEKIDELGLGWNDYGARNYDALLGRWMQSDPLAEIATSFSTYHYCSLNPIGRIDPNGMTDFNINGSKKTLKDGHDDLSMNVSSRRFRRLERQFNKGNTEKYEGLLNRTSFENGYQTGTSENGEIELTYHAAGKSTFGQYSIGSKYENYGTAEHIVRVLDSGIGSAVDQFKNINVGSNSKWYFRKDNGRIFNGNQYVSTISATSKFAKFAKGAKIGGHVAGGTMALYEIYQGYQEDGGHYGYNAKVQTCGAGASIVGGYLGAEGGAAAGAAVGFWFGGVGAVPGAIIGGFVGGAGGAWFGDWGGEQVAKDFVK